ncbi:MAG: acetate--CoA ligase family protein [Candidatus Helarchaeota archaeon]
MVSESWKEIDDIFHPRGVAIFGVSRKGGLGTLLLQGYIDMEFPNIYPINPKAAESGNKILGLDVFPDLKSIPGPVDLVVMSVHPKLVKELLIQCGEKSVRAVILFTAGFGEFDESGKERERELVEIARKYNMRLIGPNCMGIYCPATRVSFFPALPKESGPVGFISQSGSIANLLCFASILRGIRYSKMISFGNAADLNFNDFFEYLGDDPETRVIACYLEGIKDGQHFIKLAERISKKKPIIIWKVGETSSGARAAASHTGSLVGNYSLWTKIFDKNGIVVVKNHQELIETIGAFTNPCYPQGNSVAIISGPGGPAVSSADACEMNGLKLAKISPETVQELSKIIPEFGTSSKNPIDLGLQISFDSNLERKAIEAVARDPKVDMLLIYLGVIKKEHVKNLLRIQKEVQKPIAIVTAIDILTSSKGMGPVRNLFTPVPTRKASRFLAEMNANGISLHMTEQNAAKTLWHLYHYGIKKG